MYLHSYLMVRIAQLLVLRFTVGVAPEIVRGQAHKEPSVNTSALPTCGRGVLSGGSPRVSEPQSWVTRAARWPDYLAIARCGNVGEGHPARTIRYRPDVLCKRTMRKKENKIMC